MVLQRGPDAASSGDACSVGCSARRRRPTRSTWSHQRSTERARSPACEGHWPTPVCTLRRPEPRERARHEHGARRLVGGPCPGDCLRTARTAGDSRERDTTGHLIAGSGAVEAILTLNRLPTGSCRPSPDCGRWIGDRSRCRARRATSDRAGPGAVELVRLWRPQHGPRAERAVTRQLVSANVSPARVRVDR